MSIDEQIAHLADIPVPVDLELDRKVVTLREVLGWTRGSVVKLTRSAGENVDVRVGGALVGSGEVVILEGNIGVRLTDLASPD